MARKWSNLNLPGALHYVTGNCINRFPEWLCSWSGGALHFAPFPTCKLAELEPSFWGSLSFDTNLYCSN